MSDRGVLLNGLPMWAKTIATVGFPSAVAAFLIWMLVGWQTADISLIKQDLQVHATAAEQAITRNDAATKEMVYLLRRLCLNSASLPAQQQACLDGGGTR